MTSPTQASSEREALLAVDRLAIGFGERQRPIPVVVDVSFTLGRGEIVGLVGESGCGKTLTALGLLGLLPPGARLMGGRIELAGAGDLAAASELQLRRVRGARLAMIFQDPAGALNPVLTIGFQLAEVLRLHRGLRGRALAAEARRLLERVAIPDPEARLASYPHQLSGGQIQRVMIALALASQPDLLLADEPTTALDVTVQTQILDLLLDLKRDLGLTVLLITHDLGIVAECCDRALVMYAGQVVEEATVGGLFARPAHPYTRALLAAVPRLGTGDGQPHTRGIPGRVPEPGARPPGCAFHPRCTEVMDVCRWREPEPYRLAADHYSRCLLYAPAAEEQL